MIWGTTLGTWGERIVRERERERRESVHKLKSDMTRYISSLFRHRALHPSLPPSWIGFVKGKPRYQTQLFVCNMKHSFICCGLLLLRVWVPSAVGKESVLFLILFCSLATAFSKDLVVVKVFPPSCIFGLEQVSCLYASVLFHLFHTHLFHSLGRGFLHCVMVWICVSHSFSTLRSRFHELSISFSVARLIQFWLVSILNQNFPLHIWRLLILRSWAVIANEFPCKTLLVCNRNHFFSFYGNWPVPLHFVVAEGSEVLLGLVELHLCIQSLYSSLSLSLLLWPGAWEILHFSCWDCTALSFSITSLLTSRFNAN